MKKRRGVVVLFVMLLVMPSGALVETDPYLNKEISAVLTECQKIKAGNTRAELLKVFTPEGGLSTATHGTFFYRRCSFIKVAVDFNLSAPNQKLWEERQTDVITKVSKPYLDWEIQD